MLLRASASQIPIADESVQCVVTSPPYWGLRKYAGEQELVWGGEAGCEHWWGASRFVHQRGKVGDNSTLQGGPQAGAETRLEIVPSGKVCQRCGAWRGGYGLEPTVEMYVDHSVQILREVRRVLRKDGVCFWNVGDSYCGSRNNFGARNGVQRTVRKERFARDAWEDHNGKPPIANAQTGLKPKDLCLIPFRVALAAQADGWWVRSVIIWAKPNPMPESCKDRPTDAYEHILMLTKSARYFWNPEAVAEKASVGFNGSSFTSASDVATMKGLGTVERQDSGTRNLRNVWTFPTQPYPEAHFATFPEELPRRCIKAASKPGDIVLDPFGGSGTTARVALELNRRPVSLDLAYHDLARKRTSELQPQLIGA